MLVNQYYPLPFPPFLNIIATTRSEPCEDFDAKFTEIAAEWSSQAMLYDSAESGPVLALVEEARPYMHVGQDMCLARFRMPHPLP